MIKSVMNPALRFIVLLPALVSHLAWAQPRPDIENLVYGKTPRRELTLDLYLPKVSGRPPLLVYIHGGGWRGGNPKDVPFLHLLDEGIAVASIRYRFSQEARFPAQIDDVKSALSWLRENANTHGYDSSRVALAGGSAGAHLAMLAGCTTDEKTGPVRAVVSFFGPADFLLRARTQPDNANKPGSTTHGLLGGAPLDDEELAKSASPAFHVNAKSPPLLIFHGDADRTVLRDQSERMAAAYRAASRPVMTHFKPEAAHAIADFQDAESRKLLVDFLNQYLGGAANR